MDFGLDIYIMILKLAQMELAYLDWKQVKINRL